MHQHTHQMKHVIVLAVSPHSFPLTRLQHAQLNNNPYLSLLKPSHKITRQEDKYKHDNNDYDNELVTLVPVRTTQRTQVVLALRALF
jgi:hypothetical protein